jgi:hypothetical protein
MPLARQMFDAQSEFRRPQHFALRRLYKVSEFRGMGTFSLAGNTWFGWCQKASSLTPQVFFEEQLFSPYREISGLAYARLVFTKTRGF